MNVKIVASSSEIALLGLLEGQPPDLVAELTRDLRIRQALRWTGPEAFRAPFVVRRTDPDGSESLGLTSDLIAAGKLRWDSDELAFVAQPDDPTEYMIPGEDEELTDVLDHPSVPETVRDRLREYQAPMETSPDAPKSILAAVRTQFGPIGPLRPLQGAFALRPTGRQQPHQLAAKVASCGDSTATWFLHTDDGREIKVNRIGVSDECALELMYPLPEGVEPSKVILMAGDRPVEPVFPLNKYGYCSVRYSDIKDVIDGKFELHVT